MPTDTDTVVIGVVIIGSSVGHHLADMGVDGVVVDDEGPLPPAATVRCPLFDPGSARLKS